MGAAPSTRKKALDQLRITPERTREELELLLNPPSDMKLNKHQKRCLNRLKAPDAKIHWGLLGSEYPTHAIYYNFIRQSMSLRSKPCPCAYKYIGGDFLEFIIEVGLPPKEYEHPVIQLKDKEKGYVPGNFCWKDKVGIEEERAEKRKSSKKVSLKDKKYIEFQGKRYYETKVNGNLEYAWDSRREGAMGDDKEWSLLRLDVWATAHDPDTKSRIIEYIDPDGDLTDPFNMRLKAKSPSQESTDRIEAFRQATADMMVGYLKVCLGCGAQWRIIEDHVLWVREPLEKRIGPCEEKHNKIKRKKSWKSPAHVLRAGLTIPRAEVYAGRDDSGFHSRGERDDDWWED